VLQRKRLHRRLDELRGRHRAIWIAAPAGSGKTALASSYVRGTRTPTLWYRVDTGDRHAEDLFYYLGLAAQKMDGGRTSIHLPTFSPGADLVNFSRRFFEALFARVPKGAVLVFDDYHFAVEPSPWVTAFEKAFDAVPSDVQILVLSRAPPPPSLARRRVHGELAMLETRELFLQLDETLALAEKLGRGEPKDPSLTGAALSSIHESTGGWPAGVALLLRQPRTSRPPLLTADSDLKPLFDYLAHDVFDRLPPEHRDLLLCTGFLPWFTVADAEKVSRLPTARAKLVELQHSGFFLERDRGRDDGQDEVFRYHTLFQAFLRYYAGHVCSPESQREMRARATELLRSEDRGDEAFAVLREANDVEGIRDLVLRLAPCLFAQGRAPVLHEWLRVLPDAMIRREGWLEYWRASCLVISAPMDSRAGFERALDLFEQTAESEGVYLAWAGALQALINEQWESAMIFRWLGRLQEIERGGYRLESAEVASRVATSLLMGLTLVGADSESLERWTKRALSLAEKASGPGVRLMMASVLALHCAVRGQSRQASVILGTLRQRPDASPEDWVVAVAAKAASATFEWHRGHDEETLAAAREGLALMGDRALPVWQSAMLVFGSLAAIELAEWPDCDRFLAKLAALAESGSSALDVSAYHFVRAQHAFARGDLASAMSAAQLAVDRDMAIGFSYGSVTDLHLLSWLAYERGELTRAEEVLDTARRLAELYHDPVLSYGRLVIEADRALRSGERASAKEKLAQAFAIGRERDIYAAVQPGKSGLAELCRFALREDIEPEHARALIRRRRLRAPPEAYAIPGWPWAARIGTLNRVEVVINGVPVALARARRVTLLLKCIVSLGARERRVPVSDVLSILWPEADGDAAMQSFEVTLLRLRRLFGEEGHRIVQRSAGHVWLEFGFCWTDVDAIDYFHHKLLRLPRELGTLSADEQRDVVEKFRPIENGRFASIDELPLELSARDDGWRAKAVSILESIRERQPLLARI